jgi:two-component system, NtrC family, sensor kinase
LQVENRWVGALEIVQPISFVHAHITKARLDIAITVLLLFMTILLVVTFLTRHNLARPIQKLLDGAVAVGHGDLSYRVAVRPHWGELAQLAREFNRMAEGRDEQRRAAARESEEKLGLERRLRHSEHLAALGRMAAGVAHEMGAPLQVIDGRAKQLLNNPELPVETRQRNLTIIRNQAERITRIIRQMLNLSRPYHLRLERIKLALPAQETIELIEAQAASAGVKIEFVCPQEVEVEADQGLLEQVLLNIYRNAIQAMPQGGRLRIECLADALTKDGQPFAALRCSDTGSGIAPEHLAHVFDPFFTTKEVGQGTGLGLPISNRIIADHNGWIEAANGAAGGAVFTVYLPQAVQTTRHESAERVLV